MEKEIQDAIEAIVEARTAFLNAASTLGIEPFQITSQYLACDDENLRSALTGLAEAKALRTSAASKLTPEEQKALGLV